MALKKIFDGQIFEIFIKQIVNKPLPPNAEILQAPSF
jgi:hypothetical protein